MGINPCRGGWEKFINEKKFQTQFVSIQRRRFKISKRGKGVWQRSAQFGWKIAETLICCLKRESFWEEEQLTWNLPPLWLLMISSMVISSSSTSFFAGALFPSHGARSTDWYKEDGVVWVCMFFLKTTSKMKAFFPIARSLFHQLVQGRWRSVWVWLCWKRYQSKWKNAFGHQPNWHLLENRTDRIHNLISLYGLVAM